MTVSPAFTESLTTGQKYDLLADTDFMESCADDGLVPREVLGLPLNPDRAALCVSPVVLDKVNVETGETCPLVLPCGTSNALKCPSCADFMQRTRSRQIMNGLEQTGVRAALFTPTAPSFGLVHRSSYSVKDAFKVRKKSSREQEAFRLTVMKKKGKCPCGKFHDYLDELVGCPIGKYDYAGEIMFNENLPSLFKATVRKLKHAADALGIRKEDFSLFTAMERQKRGALHAHILITVKDNDFAFDALVAQIKTDWVSPVAAIPENRLRYYRSADCAARWKKFGPADASSKTPVAAIPLLTWKGRKDVPATTFGAIYDIRVIAPEQNENSEKITGHQQAAHYLSKYLVKGQNSFSAAALGDIESYHQEQHFENFRFAAIALCGDRVIAEALHDAALKDFIKFCENLPADDADLLEEDAERLGELYLEKQNHVKTLRAASNQIPASPYLDRLFVPGVVWNVDRKAAHEVSRRAGVPSAVRSLTIRLNKTIDNGGFSGTLTYVSNWNTTLKALKAEMSAWAVQNGIYVPDTASYAYSLNFFQMKLLMADRRRRKKIRPVLGVEAAYSSGLVERPRYGPELPA